MSREWKPGDVALVNDATQPEKPWKPATCHAARTPERETVWVLHDSGGKVWGSVSQARPLVVIDPEDREEVERLIADYARKVPDGYWPPGKGDHDVSTFVGAMQAALREFASPTPPPLVEQPVDLAARVVDRDGDVWARGNGSSWGCLTTQSAPQAWMDLVNVCGPLKLAEGAS